MLSTEQTNLQNSLISKINNLFSELFALNSELINKGLKVHDEESTKEQTNTTIKEQKNAEDETNNQTQTDALLAPCSKSKQHSPGTEVLSKPIRRRTHRSFPLNRSKFLNIEQREQVLHFVNENKELIMNQSRSDLTPFLQNLIRDQLIINLSTYMTERLISILQI